MTSSIASRYRCFAEVEARGISTTYYEWAMGVSGDDAVQSLIAALPAQKRQPNLVFAAARLLGAPVGTYNEFRTWLLDHWDRVLPVILSRSTQTNEAARTAVLLPLLEKIDGTIALIEAGTAAGLVLYPDRYSYRYSSADGSVTPVDPASGPSSVVIPCELLSGEPPTTLPDVIWRAGVDLNPLDVTNKDELEWLEALVWPEHNARRARLRAAARIVAEDPPLILAGDILERIPELIAQAPTGAHIVVFHSAVLVYLNEADREAFVTMMEEHRNVTWISNEGADVLPAITRQVDQEIAGRTIVARDGRPVALVGPHGQSFQQL